MRIAYLNQDPGIAPGRKKGAAVHVAAMHAALRALGCEVVAIEAKSEADAEAALAAAHAERELDRVYERYALGAQAGARFARRTGVALLLEVNAPLLDEARDERGARVEQAELEREHATFHSATHVFCVSRAVAAYVARQNVPGERIHVTPNGVDVDVFRPDLPRALELALPRDAFVLGFHGRLRPWHNLALLGEVVARLAARGYPVHVLAIGEGDFAAHFEPELRASRLTVLPWWRRSAWPADRAFDALPLCYGPAAVLLHRLLLGPWPAASCRWCPTGRSAGGGRPRPTASSIAPVTRARWRMPSRA